MRSFVIEHGRWHGPHAYVVQQRGVTETAGITTEYDTMLGRLCKLKKAWCLPQ